MSSRINGIINDIIQQFRPQTVLVLGRDDVDLISALNKQDINAYGFLANDAKREDIPEELRTYFKEGDLTGPVLQDYDLVVCFRPLEYLPFRDAENFIYYICQCTEDILLSVATYEFNSSLINLQPPEKWAEFFAKAGFYRDIEYEAAYLGDSVARYRKLVQPLSHVIANYEEKIARLVQENTLRRQISQELRQELSTKDQLLLERYDLPDEKLRLIDDLQAENANVSKSVTKFNLLHKENEQQLNELRKKYEEESEAWQKEKSDMISMLDDSQEKVEVLGAENRAWSILWDDLQQGIGWALLHRLRLWRLKIAPRKSAREGLLLKIFDGIRSVQQHGIYKSTSLAFNSLTNKFRLRRAVKIQVDKTTGSVGEIFSVEGVHLPEDVPRHTSSVDIIICVHNAFDDVMRCLSSILDHTQPPYQIIIVDDGSEEETKEFLEDFSSEHRTALIRNDQARGYTKAANQGLRASRSKYIVLLNSDTVVTADWLNRMIVAVKSHPRVGIVGPLSNTASWQSIPEIEKNGDWASNPLPEGVSIDDMGRWVGQYAGQLYLEMPFLNGFCLLIPRRLIDEIGYFDEDTFGDGYGEENDYALRARSEGWRLVLSDDTYIYHAHSRSYTTDRRIALYERAAAGLSSKHGDSIIEEGVNYCKNSRILEGIRSRSRAMIIRRKWIDRGRKEYEGYRIIFILPIDSPGGGGNVVITEAMAMREMGVNVGIFNLKKNKIQFNLAYPDLDINIQYGEIDDLPKIIGKYDAAVATFNPSVGWLAKSRQKKSKPILGYYIQDFEPYMYPSESEGYYRALDSYSLIPDLIRFTKTDWTRRIILEKVGVDCSLVGISVNIDLFRPREPSREERHNGPLRIVAMVRPSSPYRQPQLTMELLRMASRKYGNEIEILIFGVPLDDLYQADLPIDFSWKLGGVFNPSQVAHLMNDSDIFVDFSSHQAMGLTALEAMASGMAVIVPSIGGSVSFAQHKINSLVVETSVKEACWEVLQLAIEDNELRENIRTQGLIDACDYFPERPAYKILDALNTKKTLK